MMGTTDNDERNERLNIMYVRPLMDSYGVSKTIIHLAQAMKSFGHNVVVVAEKNEACEKLLREEGVDTVNAPMDPSHKSVTNYIKSVRIIANTIRNKRIDILHSHHRWGTFICFIVAKWFRIPLITTYHGIHQGNELFTVWGDRVITVSADAKHHLTDHFRLPEDKITVIPNGIPDYKPNTSDLSTPSGNSCPTSDRPPRIVNIARLSPEKDHSTLLLAMSRVISSYPTCKLIIAGDGPLKNQLIKMSEELGLDKNVSFIGEVEDVQSVLESADFTVLSSTTEGLPMAILESLACCKPVVATSVGAIPDVVEDGKTGILVPPEDPAKIAEAICLLIQNREATVEMGRMGRQHIMRNYGMTSIASTTERIYYTLQDNRRQNHELGALRNNG